MLKRNRKPNRQQLKNRRRRMRAAAGNHPRPRWKPLWRIRHVAADPPTQMRSLPPPRNTFVRCARAWNPTSPAIAQNAGWRWSATPQGAHPKKRSTPAQCIPRWSRITRAIARSAAWRWNPKRARSNRKKITLNCVTCGAAFASAGRSRCRSLSQRWRTWFLRSRTCRWRIATPRAGCNSRFRLP